MEQHSSILHLILIAQKKSFYFKLRQANALILTWRVTLKLNRHTRIFCVYNCNLNYSFGIVYIFVSYDLRHFNILTNIVLNYFMRIICKFDMCIIQLTNIVLKSFRTS
jgi:hypothetical protein